MAPAPWARKLPRTSPTPACRCCCSTSRQTAARDGLEAGARRSSRIRSSRPTARVADHHRRLRRRPRSRSPAPTGSSRRSSSSSTSSGRCSRASRRCGAHDSIVSSNTSGIPIAALAEGRSAEFRRHWLGTHFFNPPRYLHLVEVIPTADTDPRGRRARVARLRDLRLGKGVVIAKDTPNFIANRIGLFGVVQAAARARDRAATRSKRSTRSPARRSAGRRARRSGRWTSPASTCSATSPAICRAAAGRRRARASRCRHRRAADRARMDRREGRPGLLQAREDRRGSDILTLDPATMTYRAEAAAAHRLARRRARPSRRPASASRRCSRRRTRPAHFLRDTLGADARLRRGRRARRSPTRSTTSIARCGGASAGSSGRSRSGTRSASGSAGRDAAATAPPLVARTTPAQAFRDGACRRRPGPADPRSRAKIGSASSSSNAGASLVDLGDGVLARRVPLEDERHRRRHARRCCTPGVARSRRELRRARRRQRRAELLAPAPT